MNCTKFSLKPGLHIVVTIAEHASDAALKRILRLLIHRLQIFLVKYEYPPSLQPCEYQRIPGKLKIRVCSHVRLRSLRRLGLNRNDQFNSTSQIDLFTSVRI